MNNIEAYILSKLKQREQDRNLRSLSTQKGAMDFHSNDYLGLVTNGTLAAMIYERYGQNGSTGSTGSRLISGNSIEIEELEWKIAKFHKAAAALIFNSGYDANVGLLSSLIHRDTVVIYDELCHASIIDGIRLGLSNKKYKFRHNDVNDLEDRLERLSNRCKTLVIVESVYSMDGDIAPLKDITNVCSRYCASIIVDEAHATGIFGNKGEGLVCALHLQDNVFARVHTFGKALGAHGAAVVGSQLLRNHLINFARSFIYTTALPGHSIQAIDCTYRYMDSDDFTNKHLHELIAYFRKEVNTTGLQEWIDSYSPIQALLLKDNNKCKEVAARLLDAGIMVKAILHPTVPKGMERLRVCLHSFNTASNIERLISIVKE